MPRSIEPGLDIASFGGTLGRPPSAPVSRIGTSETRFCGQSGASCGAVGCARECRICSGDAARDASANRLLKVCDVVDDIPERLARRAAALRTQARRGSAIDALIVACAEPGGSVLTSDPSDLGALAIHAHAVRIERV